MFKYVFLDADDTLLDFLQTDFHALFDNIYQFFLFRRNLSNTEHS